MKFGNFTVHRDHSYKSKETLHLQYVHTDILLGIQSLQVSDDWMSLGLNGHYSIAGISDIPCFLTF